MSDSSVMPMTGQRFAECRQILGWERKPLARWLARYGWLKSVTTIRQWEEDRVRIPEPIKEWIERWVELHEKNPPPTRPGFKALPIEAAPSEAAKTTQVPP